MANKSQEAAYKRRRNWSYAAGLFEGEGWVGSSRDIHPRVAIKMTDEDVIRNLHENLGIGHVNGPYYYPKGSRSKKPYWTWTVDNTKEAYAFLIAIYPQLGQRRRAKAKSVIQAFLSHQDRRHEHKGNADALRRWRASHPEEARQLANNARKFRDGK